MSTPKSVHAESLPPALPPDLIAQRVDRARRSGKYIVCCLRVEAGRVHCDLDCHQFPKTDLAAAEKLLVEQLRELLKQ